MGAALNWQDTEDVKARRRTVEANVIRFTRLYKVGAQGTAILPARGDAVDLRGETAGSGLTRHRVASIGYGEMRDATQLSVTIQFYQVRLYSGQSYELAGSRTTASGPTTRQAVRLFATTDGTTGLPARGAAYPGDTGNTSRLLVNITDDTDQLPGLHFHACSYLGPQGYG